jgi:hypothetical protein
MKRGWLVEAYDSLVCGMVGIMDWLATPWVGVVVVITAVAAGVSLMVAVLSSCYVPPTVSPIPTPPVSPLPTPEPSSGAYAPVYEVEALDTVTRTIRLFWDAPEVTDERGWSWVGIMGYATSNHTRTVDSIPFTVTKTTASGEIRASTEASMIEFYTLITVTVGASSGEVFTYTGVNTLELPKPDYVLDCNYRLYQDGTLIQSGHIINAMQPYTMPFQEDVHPDDVVPGTGQRDGTITYGVTLNFEGLAQLYESCKWIDKGDTYPEYAIYPPKQELDEDGYYFAGLVGSPDLYVVYMPVLGSSRVEEEGD